MEEKIIHLLQQQETEAITLLYDKYGAALFGIVLKVVRSRELAEQVLQDTFLKAWRSATQFDAQKGRLFTWLLNIARNTAIDATRTNYYKFYKNSDTDEQLERTASDNNLNPDTLGVRQLVENMDEKYRVLIEKIYFEGYTQQEIEAEMGIPIGTIKTRLRYAINELRSVFGETKSGSVAVFLLFLENYYSHL
jgi:RNA polymerase sigma-70 factor (ECF subfamily)